MNTGHWQGLYELEDMLIERTRELEQGRGFLLLINSTVSPPGKLSSPMPT